MDCALIGGIWNASFYQHPRIKEMIKQEIGLRKRCSGTFNGRVRDECLNINIFWSLAQARVVITDWKDDYNQRRRHSSLGYQTPADYAAGCTHR